MVRYRPVRNIIKVVRPDLGSGGILKIYIIGITATYSQFKDKMSFTFIVKVKTICLDFNAILQIVNNQTRHMPHLLRRALEVIMGVLGLIKGFHMGNWGNSSIQHPCMRGL